MKTTLILIASTACMTIGAGVNAANAATFSGKDAGVNASGARPYSDAAASQFDAAAAALGTMNLINFESLTIGSSPTSLPGVSISGSGYTVSNNDSFIPVQQIIGFNTTSGGTKFLQTNTGNTVTFAFANPIQAFGAYINGLGTSDGEALLQFNDGSNQSYNLSTLLGNLNGGASFFGFTEAGKSIASVRFVSATGSGNDIYGIDDIRFVSSSNAPASNAIPTPALLPGLIGMGLGVWRKRKTAEASSEV